MNDEIISYLQNLYDWKNRGSFSGIDTCSMHTYNYNEIKVIAQIAVASTSLQLVLSFDTHTHLEGGHVFSAIGYYNDVEYSVAYELDYNTEQILTIKLIEASALSYDFQNSKLVVDIQDIVDDVVWTVYYTDPF